MPKDPGAVPTITVGLRWTASDGKDDMNLVADGINGGQWGYNNLQWYGFTYYHIFNEHWHIATEGYWEHQNNVLDANNPAALAAFNAGGTPFSPQYMPFNAPGLAQCGNAALFSCTADVYTGVMYLNYSPEPLDNISFRLEAFDDAQGQRTGTKTTYIESGIGWQHWFSPQIEIRPEFSFYKSLYGMAFNGNSNLGIAPTRSTALIGSADIILHF
jgi:hypothetical protein